MDAQQLELDVTQRSDIAERMNALDELLYRAYQKDLKHESPQRRRRAIKGLASLPKFADAWISALEAALKDTDYDVRQAAAAALGTLRPDR